MKKRIKLLFSNKFFRNVSTLAVGNVSTQIIIVTGSIILARLYGAEEFGHLTLFTSLGAILAIFTTGRYEYAIQLPENEQDGKSLVHLIWFIAFFVSVFYLIIIFITHFFYIGRYTELVHSNIFYLFPVYTFFAGILSSLQYWNLRKKNYKRTAKITIAQATVSTSVSIFLGLLAIRFGLIVGVISGFLTAIIVLLMFYPDLIFFSKKEDKNKMAANYVSFPKFMLFSDFAATLNQQFMPIIFTSLFSSSVVGLYAMANRMLKLPSIVLTSSISDVFKNESIDRIRATGNCEQLYKNTIKKLITIALPSYTAAFFLCPFLFRNILGSNWEISGSYAQILCLLLFFEFITVPLNSLFYIYGRQKIYMILQTFNIITSILSILLIYGVSRNVYFCLLAYSVNASFYNILSLLYTYKLSKKNNVYYLRS